jgi:hypothetical protein
VAYATDIVTLAEAKLQLNIPASDTTSDAELAGFISAATQPVEDVVGPVVNRTAVDVFDGGRSQLLLTQRPVSSITSVVDTGATVSSGSYTFNAASGVLTQIAGPSPLPFLVGVQSVTVTYVAGRVANTAAVAASAFGNMRLAALIIVQHLWDTQRPAAAGPFTQGVDDYDPRYGFSVPRRATELLGERVAGFA